MVASLLPWSPDAPNDSPHRSAPHCLQRPGIVVRRTCVSRTAGGADVPAPRRCGRAGNAALRRDQARYIDTARSRIEELERILRDDFADQAELRDAGWDAESLREDAARGTLRRGAAEGERA